MGFALLQVGTKSIGRTNRQRLAVEEGMQTVADIERDAIAIRKNMERLRALREAKEAAEAAARPVVLVAAKKKTRRKTIPQ